MKRNSSKKVIVHLPINGNKCPGQELVATRRAVELNDFAIGNETTQFSRQDLLKIGKTPKLFLNDIRQKSIPSQERTRLAITAMDKNATTDTEKTFEGGCKYLLDWYRNTFPNPN